VLVVLVAGLIFLPAALFSQQTSSPARSVRLSSVSGTVTVKRPGAPASVPAQVNTPLEEGTEVTVSQGSGATVQFENGSTIQLSGSSKVILTSLTTDAEGNKLNGLMFEQGIAFFHFIPERKDSYQVKIGDHTLTSKGNTTFQAFFSPGRVSVFVTSGSVTIAAKSKMLTVGKGKVIEYNPLTLEEIAKSHVRVVRLSYVSGTVTMKRPTSPDWENASVNTPIQEGYELSTSGDGFAEVEFENGSTARLGQLSKLLFNQLAMSDAGDKLNGMTFEQGYATFHFLPEQRDTYHVIVGDLLLTANGKSEFRTDIEQDRFRVEVFNGSIDVAAPTLSAKLGEGKILERQSGSTELAFNIRTGIDKDAWDKWTQARDKQVQLTAKDEPVGPLGLRYGWSELDTYGEWVQIPGRGFGWSPYARAGWSPYSSGTWQWYPGFGWVWISSEPWGWLPYHCGQWYYDPSIGWYWMMPTRGCLFWEASLVDWYTGPGWIGWAPQRPGPPASVAPPSGTAGPGHPPPRPPFPPRPRPVPVFRNAPAGTRRVTMVPVSVVQNRQTITPQIVKRTSVGAENRIERPPFEPAAPPTPAATAPAAGGRTTSNSNATTAAAAPGPAPPVKLGKGFAPHHSSAPSTILMGGDAKKESSLLSGFHPRSGKEPLRARGGTTLGGHYVVSGPSGEFRGETFKGGGVSGASATRGSQGGPTGVLPSGGTRAVIASHGSGGGFSRGGSGGGWGGGRGSSGGGSSGGGRAGGSSGGSGGGASAHAGGGGGGASGGGGGSAGHH
jgi:hypothetical protein